MLVDFQICISAPLIVSPFQFVIYIVKNNI